MALPNLVEVPVFLVLVFFLLTIVLGVAIFVLALFFQGYIYTQPTPGLAWRAPTTAAAMSLFFTIWCGIILGSDASPGNVPYDTIFRFTPKVEMFKDPVKKLWTIHRNGTEIEYTGRNTETRLFEYRDAKGRPYDASGIVSYRLKTPAGDDIVFEKIPTDETDNRRFRSADGWVMEEFPSGPSGVPYQSRWGRFFANFLLNVLHFVFWFLCFWLLLQFRFNDALGFAIVVWLVATLSLPVLFDEAAARASRSAARAEGRTPIERLSEKGSDSLPKVAQILQPESTSRCKRGGLTPFRTAARWMAVS